jgi:hypothetical protein
MQTVSIDHTCAGSRPYFRADFNDLPVNDQDPAIGNFS